ncbi:MAG: hypothetical protein LCH88_08995 [Proteobacteria bacterium]|nr:hypothetical protein [Pseudomonadota bacterium]
MTTSPDLKERLIAWNGTICPAHELPEGTDPNVIALMRMANETNAVGDLALWALGCIARQMRTIKEQRETLEADNARLSALGDEVVEILTIFRNGDPRFQVFVGSNPNLIDALTQRTDALITRARNENPRHLDGGVSETAGQLQLGAGDEGAAQNLSRSARDCKGAGHE